MKMKWKKIVNRKTSVLFLYFLTRNQDEKNCKKILGQDIGYRYYLYLDGDVYSPEEDFNRVSDKLEKRIDKEGYNFLKDFSLKWENMGKDLISFSKKLDKDLSSLSDKKLLFLFKKYVKKNCDLSTAIQIPLNIGFILEKKIESIFHSKIKNKKIIQDYFLTLTTPNKINENEKELRFLFSIGAYIQSSKIALNKLDRKAYKMIDEYIDEFGWMSVGRYFRDKYEREDVLKRLKDIIKENCKKRLGEIIKSEKENKEKTKEIFKKLNFTKNEKDIVNIAKNYVFLRTFRMNAFMMSSFYTRPLLSEIASRMNLDLKSIITLTPLEIIKYFLSTKKVPLKIIKERISGYGMFQENGKIIVFSKKEIDKYKNKYKIYEEIKQTSKLYGVIANRGLVKSVVRIINSIDDVDKVKTGDILVASMTIPEMISAMQKAAAFVTDEGGILCHAAIVSREMKKPCIIGTKIATKVLKDGDLVEVDANKGVVKILSK